MCDIMSIGYQNRRRQLEKLVERLGLSQKEGIQWENLDIALTHSSTSVDANYEQLEFVGDAVVRLAASEFLLETYPDQPVGEFSAIRSMLVSDRILAKIADSYGMGQYLLIEGCSTPGHTHKPSHLADCLEAVVAALYLSRQNLTLVRPWLDSSFQAHAEEIRRDPARQNYKAALQEWTQSNYNLLPQYKVKETSQTSLQERFMAQVWFQGRKVGQGKGRSIKAAEQAAAQEAFSILIAQNSQKPKPKPRKVINKKP